MDGRNISTDTDLRLLFVEPEELRGDRPINVPCLWHPDGDTESLAVYPDHGWCYGGCPEGSPADPPEGRKKKYAEDFRNAVGKEPPKRTTQKEDRSAIPAEKLPGLVAQYEKNLWLQQKHVYFLGRGLTPDSVMRARLGHTGRSYAIPIFSDSGLVTIRFRRDDEVDKSGPKYWGLYGHNDPVLYVPRPLDQGYLIWCEGELDCLLAAQLGYPAVTLTNGIGADYSVAYPILKAHGVREVRIATDCDLASHGKSLELALALKRSLGLTTRLVRFPYKDVTEIWKAGGEDLIKSYLGVQRCL